VLAIGYRRRVAAGLGEKSPLPQIARLVLMAVLTLGAVAILNSDRGVPLAVLILLGFVIGMEYVVQKTTFGRHVFAVGGNDEAARRAGIRVNGVRVAVFAIAGAMAAVGGIMAASRLFAVNQNSGGNELLLLAIAGPVIAGTSLFGGRGSVWTALLGALVIGSISNGMDLLGLPAATKYMVTGGVLLLAVIVDALARSQREASGRV
jgi:D-xylose transport system permease protein